MPLYNLTMGMLCYGVYIRRLFGTIIFLRLNFLNFIKINCVIYENTYVFANCDMFIEGNCF